jgi:hypothetical protein
VRAFRSQGCRGKVTGGQDPGAAVPVEDAPSPVAVWPRVQSSERRNRGDLTVSESEPRGAKERGPRARAIQTDF